MICYWCDNDWEEADGNSNLSSPSRTSAASALLGLETTMNKEDGTENKDGGTKNQGGNTLNRGGNIQKSNSPSVKKHSSSLKMVTPPGFVVANRC
jgi:hypothetical protein